MELWLRYWNGRYQLSAKGPRGNEPLPWKTAAEVAAVTTDGWRRRARRQPGTWIPEAGWGADYARAERG